MKGKYLKVATFFLIASTIITQVVEAKESANADGATVYNYNLLQMESSKGVGISRQVLDTSMQSIWEGIIYSNALVKMDTGTSFFCMPENLSMSGKDLQSLIDLYIKNNPQKVNPNDKVALIAVLAIRDRFPCK
ncbi:TPA: hypothetical protein ACX1S2_004212 [Yersinia enterocolitica]